LNYLTQLSNDGYALLPQFISGDELTVLLANVQRFVSDVVPQIAAEQVFYEDKQDPATLKQIQHMGDHDPWFHNLLTASRFRELAEHALHGPVVPKNLQYFNKPAGIGQPTPPHQDGFYFMLDPCEAVTIWLALDEVDAENGCVRYVTGSHRLGMRNHSRTQTLGFSQSIVDYPTAADRWHEIAVAAGPGDVLVHDALTIHRADGNRSAARSRRSLGLVYFSTRAREDVAAQAAYQKRLAAELKAAGRL
jgi:phytanoyl-CoA hydroxylase